MNESHPILDTLKDTEDKRFKLEQELRKIRKKESELKAAEVQRKNLEAFRNRPSEYLVGKAHIDLNLMGAGFVENGYAPLLPIAVSVHGNSGTTYKGKVPLTASSRLYFHNVWTSHMKEGFERRLIEFVTKEVSHITSDLRVILELLGLNYPHSGNSWMKTHFPEEALEEIEKSLDEARAEVLHRFTDEKFLQLADGTLYNGLHHSWDILKAYLTQHRPHLVAKVLSKDD
jgi:hypothetical protein